MRIAISAVMDTAKSGAWQVTKNIIKNLKTIDIKNDYLIFVEKGYQDDFGELPDRFTILRTSITASQPIRNIFWHAFVLPFLLIKYRVDILHLPWHSAALLIKTRPVVLTIHDLTEYRLKSHYNKLRTFYRKMMLPISSRLADRIIAVSNYTRDEIIRYLRIDRRKVEVIYSAVSCCLEPVNKIAAAEYLKDRYGIDARFILYVGQIQHPNKNLVRLLHAYHKVKTKYAFPHKLVLVGRQHPGAGPVYQTVKDLNLNDSVIFTGYVSDEELPYFYSTADLFVYLSFFEGFGIPPLEALSFGTPVIASRSSALPEVVGDAGILVDPLNEQEITESIRRLISDPTLREQLRDKGLKRAQLFSWEISAQKVLKLYQDIDLQ
ncbi:MAG: glycosyltransferase family 1 protein [Candidatus Omnitrophota bacterium]